MISAMNQFSDPNPYESPIIRAELVRPEPPRRQFVSGFPWLALLSFFVTFVGAFVSWDFYSKGDGGMFLIACAVCTVIAIISVVRAMMPY